jgi:hypothetical protein
VEQDDVKIKPAMSMSVKASIVAATLAAMPAMAGAMPDLGNTAWGSDPDKDCFVMGLELHANGKADIVATSMDVLTGKWTLKGKTLNATFYLAANYPPLVFKGEVAGDTMQATYTWNEGADGGPETEKCEFRRVEK